MNRRDFLAGSLAGLVTGIFTERAFGHEPPPLDDWENVKLIRKSAIFRHCSGQVNLEPFGFGSATYLDTGMVGIKPADNVSIAENATPQWRSYFVTNNHVVLDPAPTLPPSLQQYLVGMTFDITDENVPITQDSFMTAQVLYMHPSADVAIIGVDEKLKLRTQKFAEAKLGEPVYVIGYPHAVTRVISEGRVASRQLSGLPGENLGSGYFITNDSTNGMSGGRVVNQKGEMVGLMCAYIDGRFSYMIRSQNVQDALKEAKK